MPPAETSSSTATRARPFRDGLLTLQPLRLLGSRCTACDCAVFPARTFCPACRAATVDPVELSPVGRVHSFTVVRQAPPDVEVPYTLAWIDLPTDRVRLMAQVVGVPPEEVTLDMPVELEPAPFGVDDTGSELVGFRFRTSAGVSS
ncbi:OB-fold domain-containing protein [Pseudonocardia nematodicida]|uniref:OB-fold domain-containing protein n=1 Tax=Pseudonocardia nematodicida TaxID=1206997 RepID=A0ABV1KG56_9PSEU